MSAPLLLTCCLSVTHPSLVALCRYVVHSINLMKCMHSCPALNYIYVASTLHIYKVVHMQDNLIQIVDALRTMSVQWSMFAQ